jgi:selenocysteine lyase/cysteine desulfurase
VAAPDRAAGARRYEYGNPNFLGIWVQRRSALMVEEWGRANIEARIRGRTTRLLAGAGERGLRAVTPAAWPARAGIVSFDIGGADADRVEALLGAEQIRAAAKDGRIRVAPHVYNDEADIDRFLDRLAFHLRRNSTAAEAAQ